LRECWTPPSVWKIATGISYDTAARGAAIIIE
jgi:hypothetical protein